MADRDRNLEDRLLADALSGRITRRDVLRRAAALGLSAPFVSMLLAACGGGDDDDDDEEAGAPTPTTAAGETPTAGAETTPTTGAVTTPGAIGEVADVPRERTLIVMSGGDAGQNPEFESFNLFVTAAQDGWHTGPLQTMNEPLIMFNVLTGEYENWLAEDWSYNADFTELTMTLREGIEWSDGTPFTSADVVFTFNLIRDLQSEATNAAEISFLQEAVADNERTVRFVLNEANPRWWATTLTSNHGVTEQNLPKHIWEGQENPLEFSFYDPAQGWPIGTGPYRLVQTTAEQKIFDRRDDWWAVKTGFKELPQVERVIYIAERDETATAQMLITNEVDMGKIIPVPTLQSVIQQNSKVMTFAKQAPPYGYLDWCPVDINFNCDADPWKDAQLRWAVSNAIDRDALVALAEAGAGVTALHQFTPYEWFQPFEEALTPLYEKYGLDTKAHPDKVEEIMTGKGYTMDGGLWTDAGGNTVAMNIFVPDWLKQYGPPLTQQLRDGGFDAQFDSTPGLGTQVDSGEHPLGFGCKGPAGVKGMDPYFMLSIYTSAYFRPTGEPAPIWWATSRWQNQEYDEIVAQMDTLAVDDPKTMDLFVDAMDIWFRELPDVYVAQLIIRYPMSTEYWTGWPTDDDVYGFPHSWQQEFLKTIIQLQPTK
jgi:peptide/nickel transport system substrate-binding protein